MASKTRPCLGGIAKHSWEWVRNVSVSTYKSNGDLAGISLKGRYRCRNGCGAIKHGSFVPSDAQAPAGTSGGTTA